MFYLFAGMRSAQIGRECTVMVILRKMLRQSGYITLSVLVIFMVLWPFIQEYFGKIDKMSIVGVVVGVVAAFIGYFDQKLNSILEAKQSIRNTGIGDAVREAIKVRGAHVKEMRLAALTGETMLPVIKDVPCYIEKCYLMLHRYEESGPVAHYDDVNRHVVSLIGRWESLVHTGRIGTLEIAYYTQFPTEFIMLFDDAVMINGLFYAPGDTPSGAEFLEPAVIINTGIESSKWIAKNIRRFDSAFNYWRSRNGVEQRSGDEIATKSA